MSDMDADLQVTDTLSVPAWEIRERFIQSGGPGGQNVNKVATTVQLRWSVDQSSLPAPVKARFKRLFAARLTRDGEIVIEASRHRSQGRNRADARDRLATLIRQAAEPPKRRIRTRPTAGSVRRRLQSKRKRSDLKSLRGKIDPES